MAIKTKELIKILENKNQQDEVEFIVVTTKGNLVCMDVNTVSKDMVGLLKMFKS